MKIINPNKKSDVVVHQLHSFCSKFTLRVKLIEEFQEQIPDSLRFSVGYCDGCHQMSLINREDLRAMYSIFGGKMILWCDKEVDTHVS